MIVTSIQVSVIDRFERGILNEFIYKWLLRGGLQRVTHPLLNNSGSIPVAG